ncbi:hypothetical protein PFAG_02068 [Plasmodium falciparum Santa Lucia]|uniref:Uncharacterized protein n=1 Tax=Plasmodium falciparum Santa Lucia TaxID=478859 RepID=W7FRP7_PLAFA|nr:hypothetical protein PFAG_02068 [Plasmodium falciparum Santa Lucia]
MKKIEIKIRKYCEGYRIFIYFFSYLICFYNSYFLHFLLLFAIINNFCLNFLFNIFKYLFSFFFFWFFCFFLMKNFDYYKIMDIKDFTNLFLLLLILTNSLLYFKFEITLNRITINTFFI